MSIKIEHSERGIQNIRTVADVINNCNLACHYCHPNFGWSGEYLTVPYIQNILEAAEQKGIFEVTLTGGEITMHPEFAQILEASSVLDKTSLTFVTNATKITPNIIKEIKQSNVGRVCVSLDGPDAETHNSRRGKNFDQVIAGLRHLQDINKPITVISFVHPQNYQRILELSELLANEHLAEQHHMCAPSYSGNAKKMYEKVSLKEPHFHELQRMIDDQFENLKNKGLFVTFNSYWPATGLRGNSQNSRTMTLIQFTEQVKDIYMIVRPNGDVRLTSAAWGRETVGNAIVGNLHEDDAGKLFDDVDSLYRSGRVLQLPRSIEAGHKFHIGPQTADFATTNQLINTENPDQMVDMQTIRKISDIDLLQAELPDTVLQTIAQQVFSQPERWRITKHASGVDLLYDRNTSHLTVLKPEETLKLNSLYEQLETKVL